jgi:hypothetical protein
MRALLLVAFAALTGACAPPPNTGEVGAAPQPAEPGAATRDTLVPPGYGSLKQDEVTLAIRSGATLVKVTPLDEGVIRLLAPDTYRSLHALREARTAEATRGMMRPAELILVSFFSYEPDVMFQPEDVQLMYQGRLLRAHAIVPVTNGWGRQRLGQQETQMAVYAFEGPFDYGQQFTVRYGMEQNDDWRTILTRLATERAKVLARVR